MNRLDRLYALAEELRASAPRVRTARALADRFEVSTRTIERDLLALQEAGVPVWATPGPGGGYTVDPAMTLPSVNFTADEAIAIAVALAQIGTSPFADAARTALRKVAAAMSAPEREAAEDLVSRVTIFGASARRGEGSVVATVQRAVTRRCVVELDYVDRHAQRTEARPVEAHGLAVTDDGIWYLLGWCRLRDDERIFRLDRVESARLTDEAAPVRAEVGEAYPLTRIDLLE